MNASGRAFPYLAVVTYRKGAGQETEETFPVKAPDRSSASDLALAYVLQVLKLEEFELRIVGA